MAKCITMNYDVWRSQVPEGLQLKLDARKVKALIGRTETREMLEWVAAEAETLMKGFAPVRTGNLRRSITHRVYIKDNSWAALVGTNVRYAIFQEYGTRFHPEHPFVRPALMALQRRYG
jgi:HK97 gp10 family phage protein